MPRWEPIQSIFGKKTKVPGYHGWRREHPVRVIGGSAYRTSSLVQVEGKSKKGQADNYQILAETVRHKLTDAPGTQGHVICKITEQASNMANALKRASQLKHKLAGTYDK